MASPSTSKPDLLTGRHCAFCLISISGVEVKLCGKCGRRAYCSRECQIKDWKNSPPPGKEEPRGQGHKNWCDALCGEEDLDWKVAPVEGKGLGIIALRAFPARSRIFVEAGQISAKAHPAIKDLMPPGTGEENLKEKWELNSLGCDALDEEKVVLALRMSRVNHACNNNAMHIYCNTLKVKILFAERDIAAGEEVCITYHSFKSSSASTSKSPHHRLICTLRLMTKWGIQCPKDCECTDMKILGDVKRAVDLDTSIFNLARAGRVEPAMRAVKVLMSLHDGQLASSFLDKRRNLYDGFQIGIMKKATFAHGIECMKRLVEIMADILHPKSATMENYQRLLNSPGSHYNFMILQ